MVEWVNLMSQLELLICVIANSLEGTSKIDPEKILYSFDCLHKLWLSRLGRLNRTFFVTSKVRSPWYIKIMMACLRTILRNESQTVGNSPLCCSSLTLNPTYLPELFFIYYEKEIEHKFKIRGLIKEKITIVKDHLSKSHQYYNRRGAYYLWRRALNRRARVRFQMPPDHHPRDK